jgi:hypothetical protein
MPLGLDKGYHIFISVCKKLAKAAKDIMFHVVGGYDRNEIDIGSIDNRIIFYGSKDHSFFPEFYSTMDIIISPNAPFILIPGKNYDGFPTGCCIDAGLHNVVVFCTDMLHQNAHFEHKKNIFIISLNASDIADNVMEYYHDTEKLYMMSAGVQTKFREVFNFEKQMGERASVLDQYVSP